MLTWWYYSHSFYSNHHKKILIRNGEPFIPKDQWEHLNGPHCGDATINIRTVHPHTLPEGSYKYRPQHVYVTYKLSFEMMYIVPSW